MMQLKWDEECEQLELRGHDEKILETWYRPTEHRSATELDAIRDLSEMLLQAPWRIVAGILEELGVEESGVLEHLRRQR